MFGSGSHARQAAALLSTGASPAISLSAPTICASVNVDFFTGEVSLGRQARRSHSFNRTGFHPQDSGQPSRRSPVTPGARGARTRHNRTPARREFRGRAHFAWLFAGGIKSAGTRDRKVADNDSDRLGLFTPWVKPVIV